jgi:hypothetical protein
LKKIYEIQVVLLNLSLAIASFESERLIMTMSRSHKKKVKAINDLFVEILFLGNFLHNVALIKN